MGDVAGIEQLERALAVEARQPGKIAPESVYGSYGFESGAEASTVAREAVRLDEKKALATAGLISGSP